MDNSRVFMSLRSNAKFTGDQVNFFSLETIAKTYIGGDIPNQDEMDAKWLIIQTEDDRKDAIEAAKIIRNDALNALVHNFSDGRIMQTRPKDESNIRNAIEIMEANSIANIGWSMVDDIKQPVTVAELKAALVTGQMGALAIWDAYNP